MADLTELQQQILKLLREGKSAGDVADETHSAKSTVYAMVKRRDAGEFDEDTVAGDKRVTRRSSSAVAQPVEGGGDESGIAEIDGLRQRNIELTEFALDTAMENAKLKRILAGRG